MAEDDVLDAEADAEGKKSEDQGYSVLIASGGRGCENRTTGHREDTCEGPIYDRRGDIFKVLSLNAL